MKHTSLCLGGNWQRDEWPDHITVWHETCADERKYMPERTCHMLPTRSATYCTVHQFMSGNQYDMDFGYVKCSECGAEVFDCPTVSYCPSCGAKVVGE